MSIPLPNLDVLMLGWELPPFNSGGLGVACYGLSKGLSQNGCRVHFALPRILPYNVNFLHVLEHSFNNLEVTAINALLPAYASDAKYTFMRSHMNQEYLSLYGNNLYEECNRYAQMASSWARKQPHDVIHAHDWMTYPAALESQKVSGRPFVAHIHATEFDRTGGSVNEQIAHLEYEGLSAAQEVIAVSRYTKEMVHKHYSVPLSKIKVVHNGVDMVEFSASNIRRIFPRDKIVLFVGRLTFQKGVEYFLQSAQKVLQTNPNTVFIIAGHGDMYQKLVLHSASLGISKRVLFAGFQTGEKLRSIYQMADVFVMPSVSEPYGIVALEAIASGTPAIISKQSGVSETLNNVFKVDFWDIEKMTNMINSVIEYPNLSREMAKLARMEATQLTWEKAAKKTREVYEHLLQ